ncbi:MAG: competence protein ComEC, partial [Gaiellales bacterium]|nr:competence protein ComEC [Gaiellales bacterium]
SHHGSGDDTLDRLLERLRPRLAVISVGARNRYGHPSPATLATLARAHVPVRRTDLEGDISLACGPVR